VLRAGALEPYVKGNAYKLEEVVSLVATIDESKRMMPLS
jgi:hypothetical protein